MKVRLLKDWGFNKAGDVVEVFDPTGQNWILNGIATEDRSVPVEQSIAGEESVERAVITEKRRMPKRPA